MLLLNIFCLCAKDAIEDTSAAAVAIRRDAAIAYKEAHTLRETKEAEALVLAARRLRLKQRVNKQRKERTELVQKVNMFVFILQSGICAVSIFALFKKNKLGFRLSFLNVCITFERQNTLHVHIGVYCRWRLNKSATSVSG